MTRMWMVRGEGGSLYDAFRELGVVAVGWNQLAAHAKPGVGRKQLIALYQSADPQTKHGTVVSGASQVWRFINDIQEGDWVITYSPVNRLYSIGNVSGAGEHHPEWAEQGMPLARKVQWQKQELPRDSLSATTKNSLGSTLTLFEIPPSAAAEVLAALKGKPAPVADDEAEEAVTDPLADIESQALERIKDRVNELGWDDMQQLVAGILRAMGYKTQVSPPGSDRGKDIVASPDGFGFEHPRIVVEVKHRKGQMGSQEIRSFLGGRHKDDRGLYVSTGGFSKDAQYEADRAPIPLAMWTLDHVVRALIEHYDATDAETKRIVPLKRLYWPA
ncbi:restriction endonuclease [Xanthomonas translucens pv. poae]|uniref:Restriction endonuclease n=1 Tax=Xanthomonas graminis pv. poae TaxID=227946 RepID=A0A0K3A5F6_9XANT|nr:restriction endonuclease [Xanthomonas translucens]UKE63002.1 restriction endonuclease [Xanthomonas translucens pv. poae]CTP93396.1 restriction endonuclease [Xanthomonas translucens pv. poae]